MVSRRFDSNTKAILNRIQQVKGQIKAKLLFKKDTLDEEQVGRLQTAFDRLTDDAKQIKAAYYGSGIEKTMLAAIEASRSAKELIENPERIRKSGG
ncbi:MAG: hypothetical protein RL528_1707 [Bacteroidota bacterium]|jgi:predicted YcjX-like family ATPase